MISHRDEVLTNLLAELKKLQNKFTDAKHELGNKESGKLLAANNALNEFVNLLPEDMDIETLDENSLKTIKNNIDIFQEEVKKLNNIEPKDLPSLYLIDAVEKSIDEKVIGKFTPPGSYIYDKLNQNLYYINPTFIPELKSRFIHIGLEKEQTAEKIREYESKIASVSGKKLIESENSLPGYKLDNDMTEYFTSIRLQNEANGPVRKSSKSSSNDKNKKNHESPNMYAALKPNGLENSLNNFREIVEQRLAICQEKLKRKSKTVAIVSIDSLRFPNGKLNAFLISKLKNEGYYNIILMNSGNKYEHQIMLNLQQRLTDILAFGEKDKKNIPVVSIPKDKNSGHYTFEKIKNYLEAKKENANININFSVFETDINQITAIVPRVRVQVHYVVHDKNAPDKCYDITHDIDNLRRPDQCIQTFKQNLVLDRHKEYDPHYDLFSKSLKKYADMRKSEIGKKSHFVKEYNSIFGIVKKMPAAPKLSAVEKIEKWLEYNRLRNADALPENFDLGKPFTKQEWAALHEGRLIKLLKKFGYAEKINTMLDDQKQSKRAVRESSQYGSHESEEIIDSLSQEDNDWLNSQTYYPEQKEQQQNKEAKRLKLS